MLRAFGALPTEARARQMRDRDYLWCLTHMVLDREEELERLCPSCRIQAQQGLCPGCGRPVESVEGAINPHFDPARFAALGKGETT